MPKVSQKHKDLGIFYTPKEIVEFIYDILLILKKNQDKRWLNKKGKPKYPSVLDPAVGEGIFLKKALEKKFTRPDFVWGIDIDQSVEEDWEKINLLKSFGSTAKLEKHFFVQNGLLDLPKITFLWKRGGLKEFDLVIGNPPYGGLGIKFDKNTTKENWVLLEQLRKFKIFGYRKIQNGKNKRSQKNSLFDIATIGSHPIGTVPIGGDYWPKDEEIEKMPIEILFLERFIQLAKPDGWIAIIIPDGILTNSNSHFVREFIAEKTKVEAIISLPRGAFKRAGTNAKTSILFLTKQQPKTPNYPIFLASINKIENNLFNKVVKYYKEFVMNKTNLVQITNDQTGEEIAMVRADKVLKEMMEEKPASRWDSAYWHPKYDEVLKGEPLGNFIQNGPEGITYGAIITGKKNNYVPDGVPVIRAEQIKFTGIDLLRSEKTKEDSPWDPKRSRVYFGDLVFVRSGVGSLGKSALYLGKKYINVGCFVDRIKLKDLSSLYVDVYLKTNQGKLQIERLNAGVAGTTNISFDQIKSIKIPILPNKLQKNIDSEYKKISAFHDKAMEAKNNNDEAEYKKNIKTAEKMLKDLIKKTEEVIEGKRKDVI